MIKAVLPVRDGQHAALVKPIAQDDALALDAIHRKGVHRGPVGMAMNETGHIQVAKAGGHGSGVNIHDGLGFCGHVLATAGASRPGLLKALGNAQGQKAALPVGVTHLGTEGLIGRVIRTQGVPVLKSDPLIVNGDNHGLVQQLGARGLGECAAQQKVAVAVHEEYPGALVGQCPQGRRDGIVSRARVITNPGLEQVPQNVERRGLAGGPGQKTRERMQGRRSSRVKVKIRNKKNGRGVAVVGMPVHFGKMPPSAAACKRGFHYHAGP